MTKNKLARYIANSAVVAVMAAAGIGVYQLGTTPSEKEKIRNESENISSDEQEEKEEQLTDTAGGRESKKEQAEETKVKETQSVGNTSVVSKQNENKPNEKKQPDEEKISKEETKDVSAGATAATKLNFSEDTLMEWPVEGTILRDYNMNQTVYYATLDQYKLSPAIVVDAEEGEPVTCSVKGKVYSVNEDAQTGTTLTMEIGNGYQTIYGQLKDVTVQKGDTVEKGTVIGYINKPTRYYSREGSNLYFAMKKNGEPVDPIVYLP